MTDVNNGNRPVDDNDEAQPDVHVGPASRGGVVPDDRVDWEAFHTKLAARAELSLARLRYPLVAVNATPESIIRLPIPATHRLVAARRPLVAAHGQRIRCRRDRARRRRPHVSEGNGRDCGDEQRRRSPTSPTGRRAAFESAAIGRNVSWTIDSTLPSGHRSVDPVRQGEAGPMTERQSSFIAAVAMAAMFSVGVAFGIALDHRVLHRRPTRPAFGEAGRSRGAVHDAAGHPRRQPAAVILTRQGREPSAPSMRSPAISRSLRSSVPSPIPFSVTSSKRRTRFVRRRGPECRR